MTRHPAPEVSIVVPVHNQPDLVIKCFRSVQQHTRRPYEIVWVDNGSKPESIAKVRQSLTSDMNVKLTSLKTNTGFIKATNLGIKKSLGKYIILLNDDTEVSVNWVQKLTKPLSSESGDIGAVGPVTQSKIAWQEAVSLNRRWKLGLPKFNGNKVAYGEILDKRFADRYIKINSLPLAFFCVALKKETFDKVGLLDEDFGMGLVEDDEFCHRLRKNGLRIVLSVGTFVYHHHRTTFRSLRMNVDQMLRENIKQFRKKRKVAKSV